MVKESNLCLVAKFAFVTLYKTSFAEWDDGISTNIYGAQVFQTPENCANQIFIHVQHVGRLFSVLFH